MGVNTLAYRLPRHRTFFHLDGDCVGIKKSVPWGLNRQWLDSLVRPGGTMKTYRWCDTEGAWPFVV